MSTSTTPTKLPRQHLPTTGWNVTMSIRDIFDQLASTYGKPTPDAMRQNNVNFLAVYNPQDPPEIQFKQCTDAQEIATLAKNPYTTQQLLINAIDLFARCGLYQRDLEDWERKPLGTRHGSIRSRSSKKRTRDVSHQGRSRQRKADLNKKKIRRPRNGCRLRQ